jgi:hypothetical protein
MKSRNFWQAEWELTMQADLSPCDLVSRVQQIKYCRGDSLLTCLITYLLTHSNEHSPSWEANRFVANQEISRILWNPKVHYRIHNSPPPVSILSQPNPAHTPTSHFLKIRPNIILPFTPGSPQWFLSLRFPYQNLYPPLSSPIRGTMPRPSHSSRFYHPHCIGWGVQITVVVTGSLNEHPFWYM